jgi:hypothetical protein
VSHEWKKRLETKYNVQISLNELNGTKTLVIDNCARGVYEILETEIVDELFKKKMKIFVTKAIPGFGSIIESAYFKHEIEQIEGFFSPLKLF